MDNSKSKEVYNIFIQNDSDSDTCFDLRRDNDSEEKNYKNSSTESDNDSGLDSGYDSDEEIYVYWHNLTEDFREKLLKLKNFKDENKFLKEYGINNIPLTYFFLSKKDVNNDNSKTVVTQEEIEIVD